MTVTDNVKNLLILLMALFVSQAAQAQLEIEIISGNASALPIAIVPFRWEDSSARPVNSVEEIVSDDLYRSGLFSLTAG